MPSSSTSTADPQVDTSSVLNVLSSLQQQQKSHPASSSPSATLHPLLNQTMASSPPHAIPDLLNANNPQSSQAALGSLLSSIPGLSSIVPGLNLGNLGGLLNSIQQQQQQQQQPVQIPSNHSADFEYGEEDGQHYSKLANQAAATA